MEIDDKVIDMKFEVPDFSMTIPLRILWLQGLLHNLVVKNLQ
uniref:Uncharacterized protein n=1 Tax=Rhizophora mucronata TaxID=61149 RepID=A0A2P2LX94_RHIMU